MSEHPSQKRYPPELKERAVRMVLEIIKEQNGERHGVVLRIARQLGIGVETLRHWVSQAEIDEGLRPGMSSSESEQIKVLNKENRELKRANEILKAAASFMPTPRLCRKPFMKVDSVPGQLQCQQLKLSA